MNKRPISTRKINQGKTPLIIASITKDEHLINYLIRHGSNINKEDINGETAFYKALFYEKSLRKINTHIIRSLIKHGAEVDKFINKEVRNGFTPLTLAINVEEHYFDYDTNEYEYATELLIKIGADVNQIDNNDNTPLIEACIVNTVGNKDIMRYLVEHGADVNKSNKNGKTPLIEARRIQNKSIVKYFMDHGAI